MSYNPYQNNYRPRGYYGHMSTPDHPNSRGQIRGGFGYVANQFWDHGRGAQLRGQNYQGHGGNFNQGYIPVYSGNTIYGGLNPYLAQNFNSSNWHQQQMGIGEPQGSWRPTGPDFNLGSRGQHQRGTAGPRGGPRGTSRSGLNNLGSRGQNQRGNGGPRGTSRSGLNNLGSRGQIQRGNGGPRGTSRSGLNNLGSRGQNQRGNGGPQGTSRSGHNNVGSHSQHQWGNGGSQGPLETSRSGLNNLGSRGQNQRGNGGPRGTSRSGHNNVGSRSQHQRGNRGSQGPQRTSRSGLNNLGSRGQNQKATAAPQGSWRTSRSTSNDLESHDQRGNWNENKGTGTIPKAQQESEIFEKYLDFSFLVQPNVVDLMKQFKVMFILRGLPGSGKSTVADTLFQKYHGDAVICSADYYRYNKQGEYAWSRDSLQETHAKCQRRADKYCGQNKPVVIIDNTNVTDFEMTPYFQTAKKYGYIVVLTEPRTPWKLNPRELVKRNKHKVPLALLSKKCDQFEDIFPLYFAWFISSKYCSLLREGAKDILQGCLEIDNYKEYMARISGKNASNYTVHDATSMYSITKADDDQGLHVTACFSPSRKCLGGSPYIKSRQVQNSLGHVSWITIVGWVLTQKTFSARVALTKPQQKLWGNEDQQRQETAPAAAEQTSSMLANLIIEEEKESDEIVEKPRNKTSKQPCVPNVASHITFGTATNVDPVESKYDNQTIIKLELKNHPYDEYVISNGTVRKYGDVMWVVYLSEAIKVPGLFSGCYNASKF